MTSPDKKSDGEYEAAESEVNYGQTLKSHITPDDEDNDEVTLNHYHAAAQAANVPENKLDKIALHLSNAHAEMLDELKFMSQRFGFRATPQKEVAMAAVRQPIESRLRRTLYANGLDELTVNTLVGTLHTSVTQDYRQRREQPGVER